MLFRKIFKSLLSIFVFSCYSTILVAQNPSLSIPLNIRPAFENGTRSFDGNPGPDYWQNRTDYKISAEIIPSSRILKGDVSLTYYNNSPDSLRYIVIRLYPDFYRKGSPRDFSISPTAINDGVTINKLIIRSDTVDLDSVDAPFYRTGTNMIIKLSEEFPPKTNIDLKIGWEFIIPDEALLRMGAYDSTSFFVAYWYPQVAVYDDIDGWDRNNYSGTQEFYNDFGSFDVDIKMPHEFLVWATGTFINPDEILREKYLNRYKESQISDTVVNVVKQEDYDSGPITKGKEFNTWKFKADYVPDFAFAVSDHYLWDAGSVVVDETTGRKVVVGAAYKKESEDFYEVAQIGINTVKSLSTDLPGVPFPYSNITVFNGSGGMEFPMMVNDGSASSRAGTVGVTSHEITHTYFPFYMGINERKYAFMDEGMAVMLPFDLQKELEPTSTQRERNALGYESMAGEEMEIPLMVSSTLLTGRSYRTSAYSRPGLAYEFLQDYLGRDKFRNALKEYIKRWNGKHPIPYDFFFTFDEMAGENLSWYWKPWFFEFGYPDLSIKEVKSGMESTSIVIEKLGNIPIPVKLTISFEDETKEEHYRTVEVWKQGNLNYTVEIPGDRKIVKVELGDNEIPDVDRGNNVFVEE